MKPGVYHTASKESDRSATGETMKNPLDSLQSTVVLGFVLTVVLILLIHAIA